PTPFTVSIFEDRLQQFNQLLKLSPVGIDTYENQQEDLRFGLSRKWLSDAKAQWEHDFDWRAHEKDMNTFPHYTLPVKDPLDGRAFTIHFIALFSTAPNPTPIVFYHGWPG
ncbi:epoxide hydrolase, partial [Fomitopsis betulina]